MAKMIERRGYRPTESQFKGTADEVYITYDSEQKTRGGGKSLYPRVKRVYIAGNVTDWKVGDFNKRSGQKVHGVSIEYEQSRKGYRRGGYTAKRGKTTYKVGPTTVKGTSQKFRKIVEVPNEARNVQLHARLSQLPEKYHQALQDVR